jgi:hypothetical protein
MNMIYLLVQFLILRIMIQYHIMIPLSSLSLLIVTPYQIFANMIYYDTTLISLFMAYKLKAESQIMILDTLGAMCRE